jgi:hypothetical protein
VFCDQKNPPRFVIEISRIFRGRKISEAIGIFKYGCRKMLENYRTEKELAAVLKEKTGKGCVRNLQIWRSRRIGPPWMKLGGTVLYPIDGFESWLRSQVQEPVRSRQSRRLAGGEVHAT